MPLDTTLEDTRDGWLASTEPSTTPALCIAWTITDPTRVGEVALLSGDGPWVLGRGEGSHRLEFLRQRPGEATAQPPLSSPRLSREQLAFDRSSGGLRVRNTGRRTLVVNGREVDEAALQPGDTVYVQGELLLLLVRRPTVLPALRAWQEPTFPFGRADGLGMVGESPAMWALREDLAFAAGRPAHVLIAGESGTGKELAAHALHTLSPRGGRSFVGRSAVTIPDTLIDAELFGNRKNYPNPGMPEREGLVGRAHQSTLFLDEIGELPESAQAHLLRVLDEGEYSRLGEARTRHADLRLVAATNRTVDHLKHDLAARLEVRIHTPGLDDRRGDVPLLVDHLLRELAVEDPWIAERFFQPGPDGLDRPRLDPALIERLLHHDYEHHAREIRRMLWRAMKDSPGSYIQLTRVLEDTTEDRSRPPSELTPDAIRAALERNDGNRSATWKELGLRSRHQLYRLMKKHDIEG